MLKPKRRKPQDNNVTNSIEKNTEVTNENLENVTTTTTTTTTRKKKQKRNRVNTSNDETPSITNLAENISNTVSHAPNIVPDAAPEQPDSENHIRNDDSAPKLKRKKTAKRSATNENVITTGSAYLVIYYLFLFL